MPTVSVYRIDRMNPEFESTYRTNHEEVCKVGRELSIANRHVTVSRLDVALEERMSRVKLMVALLKNEKVGPVWVTVLDNYHDGDRFIPRAADPRQPELAFSDT